MAHLKPLLETIIPLTNSRGFRTILRFDYKVGKTCVMPLVVSPHILTLGEPYFTRQALYFLNDVDCAIRMYSADSGPTSQEHDDEIVDWVRSAADNCLFVYSMRNPTSRLTTRSELPPKRVAWQRTELCIKRKGFPDATYAVVDNERVCITEQARLAFIKLFDTFIEEIYDKNTDDGNPQHAIEAYPFGLTEGNENIAPVRLQEPAYTYDELEILSRVVPLNPEMVGKYSVVDLMKKSQADARTMEAQIALLNQPYVDGAAQMSKDKMRGAEFIEVTRTYNPRLLDFYFAGLRSLSPVVEFKNYYNVIEYFFQDAALDGIKARLDDVVCQLKQTDDLGKFSKLAESLKPGAERDQIREVIRKHITRDRVQEFLREEVPKETRHHFENFDGARIGKGVGKVKPSTPDLLNVVAERIYEFRNAIFHSKRTGKGDMLRPCSSEERDVVSHESMLLKMIAQEIIQQTDSSPST